MGAFDYGAIANGGKVNDKVEIPAGLAARIYACELEVRRLQTLAQAEARRLADLVALAREMTGAGDGQQPQMQLVFNGEATDDPVAE